RAEAQRAHGGFLGGHGGDHEDRDVAEPRVGLEPLQQHQPVGPGHHDVEHEQVVRLGGQLLHHRGSAVHHHHLVLVLLEDPGEGAGERQVVIGDQDAGLDAHPAINRLNSSGSTLPPLTTATVGPAGRSRPPSSAATAAAPEGSTRHPWLCHRNRTAAVRSSSLTRAASFTTPAICWKGIAPTAGASSPSAMLFGASTRAGAPAARAAVSLAAPSGSTPTTRTPGFRPRTAVAIPPRNP